MSYHYCVVEIRLLMIIIINNRLSFAIGYDKKDYKDSIIFKITIDLLFFD